MTRCLLGFGQRLPLFQAVSKSFSLVLSLRRKFISYGLCLLACLSTLSSFANAQINLFAFQANRQPAEDNPLALWGLGTIVAAVICYGFFRRKKPTPPKIEYGTTELVEMPPELRLWTEEDIEFLLSRPLQLNQPRGLIGSFLYRLETAGTALEGAGYRIRLLEALKGELTLRIELRNLELQQKLTEHNAMVQQVQIENHRLQLLRQRNNPHLKVSHHCSIIHASSECGGTYHH